MTDEIIQRVKDFRITFQTKEGERVLDYLSKYCLEHNATFDPSSATNTAFNEGARKVILEIRRIMNIRLDEKKQEFAVND